MSTFAIKIERIVKVESHPNADRLDLIQVLDWRCVSQRGLYKEGDLCIYFPIDSILPAEVESVLFGPDAKVKLHNSRIKTIKLRGAISQGMCALPKLFNLESLKEGTDVTAKLGVKKYESLEASMPNGMSSSKGSSTLKQINPHFRKYTSIENAKNYPGVFFPGEIVSASEKLHGSNFRSGYVPFYAYNLWKKLLKFFHLAPKFDFVFGSHNVQLQSKFLNDTFYGSNVYAEAVTKYKLRERLKPGEVVFGEIIGDGIQQNYKYGCNTGERKLVLFDVMIDGKYLDVVAFHHWCRERDFEFAPVLYAGDFDLEKIRSLTIGNSVYAPSQKVREGVVVKPLIDTTCHMGRKMLKFISDEYLLKEQTEFH